MIKIPNAAHIFKKDKLTDLQVVQYAYRFFKAFNGLAVDLRLSFSERNKSREFFIARSAEDAFRVVEVELNFLYEVLFTKFPVMYSRLGYCSRCFSSLAIIISLVLFYRMEKTNIYGDEFKSADVRITYTFLFGAITLDVYGYIMLIYSNRSLMVLSNSPDEDKSFSLSIFGRIRSWLLKKNIGTLKSRSSWFFLPMMNRRWGESMSTFNLIYYSLHKRPRMRELLYDFFCITRSLDEIWYVDRIRFTIVLRDFIFEELKEKSKIADDLETAKEIFSATGEWVLQKEDYGRETLLPFIVDVDLDECLLMWHIATDLCFYDQEDEPLNKDYRNIAKLISDYMMYLLVMRPDMMTEVVGVGLARFQDTCAEAGRLFRNSNVEPGIHFCGLEKKDPTALQRACESILALNTEVELVTIKGDKGISILSNAAILAKELRNLPQKVKEDEKIDKWFIISKVWVELLSFAATHMRSDSHAQQLGKGGDLVTIVWLLMAHFGLGEHYRSIGDDESSELDVLDFVDVAHEFE